MKRQTKNLSELLRRKREERGITLEDASMIMGVTISFLHACEAGHSPFPPLKIPRIHRVYGMDKVKCTHPKTKETVFISEALLAFYKDIEETLECSRS